MCLSHNICQSEKSIKAKNNGLQDEPKLLSHLKEFKVQTHEDVGGGKRLEHL